jgi:hypothetical protein
MLQSLLRIRIAVRVPGRRRKRWEPVVVHLAKLLLLAAGLGAGDRKAVVLGNNFLQETAKSKTASMGRAVP